MNIERLNSNVISKIRSSCNVGNLAQCISELVCNSLDAQSSSIAVRVNLETWKIQVADNGAGITKDNLELLGLRYATNKRKEQKTYGFRGESLASIARMCGRLSLSSRAKPSSETYVKIWGSKGQSEVKRTKFRASPGTTVTVFDWLSAVPVRRLRIVPEQELEETKRALERLILINPSVSFTLRNDVSGLLLINSPRRSDLVSAFCHLHPEIADAFVLHKISRNRISLEMLIHKDMALTKAYQYIYVNKRPASSSRIARRVSSGLCKGRKGHPVYVLSVRCPWRYLDNSPEVEFTCWDLVLTCIDKIIKVFLGVKEEEEENKAAAITEPRIGCGVSQMRGAVQAAAYKRKNEAKTSQKKIPRVDHTWGELARQFEPTQTSGDYEIEDSGPLKPFQAPKRKAERPKRLGVKIRPQFDQRSVYSKLNVDEDRGKDLIMDMFLKSTQVYKPTGSKGVNTTMSISVNIKREGVETSQKPQWGRQKTNRTELAEQLEEFTLDCDETNDNYTLLVNTVSKKTKKCVFVKKRGSEGDIMAFKPVKLCQCHAEEGNMFDFRGKKDGGWCFDSSDKALGNSRPLFRGASRRLRKCESEDLHGRNCEEACPPVVSPYFPKHGLIKGFYHMPQLPEDYGTSHFVHANPFHCFPQMHCCQYGYDSPYHHPQGFLLAQHPNQEMAEKKAVSDEEMVATKSNHRSPSIFSASNGRTSALKEFCDLECFGLTDRQKVIEKDLQDLQGNLEVADGNNKNDFFSSVRTSNEKIVIDSQNEWLRRFNDRGDKFFVNQRTGMVTAKTPLPPRIQFDFEQRLDFIPKGLSPVMKGHKPIDKALSQRAKSKLHQLILEGYEEELTVVKWRNFTADSDPKTFFEELYKEKSKRFESNMPKMHHFDPISFDGEIFKNLHVIGQLDKKFMVVREEAKNLLILFDQHAVHERIRLERYLKEYRGSKTALDKTLTIFLPAYHLFLLRSHLDYLDSVGVGVQFFTNGIHVAHVPTCIWDSFRFNHEELSKILNIFIKQTVELLESGTIGEALMPKVLQDIINLKSCRGAIKFGDSLTVEECKNHLKDLSKCKLPFQCAHGRPTLAPILSLDKVPSLAGRKPHLNKLRE